jgi:hypothetical protein
MSTRFFSWSAGAALFFGLCAVGACDSQVDPGGGGGAGAGAGQGAGPPVGLPCDVATILQSKCQTCHTDPPKYGAAMPLVDRADLLAAPQGTAKESGVATVGDAILLRIESAESPMPPPPELPLSDAEKATLAAYVGAGMPESTDTCGAGGAGGGGGGYELPCTPDIVLAPAAPYEMPATSIDEYVCFGVEAPSDIARHITAIAPQIDNETIIHHLLLLQTPNPVSAQGEPCDFVNIDWKLIYAWGPGTPPLVLPEQAGYPVGPSEPGHFVLQMHYNNVMGLSGETDQTGIAMCSTTELRPNDADIMAFGGTSFDIGPNQEATLECDTPLPSLVGAWLPVNVFMSWPHMHQLGRRMESFVAKGSGGQQTLASVPNYDFEYQITYPVGVTLEVGDTVTTRCTWQNTTGSPVGFGEGTGDEMCFNFLSYYPRITAPQWHWLLPAYSASCSWVP